MWKKINVKHAKSLWNAKILPAKPQKTHFLSLLKLIATQKIYLYTCNICQIQYIGETKNSLKERANAHRSQIMCKDSNHALYKHLVSNPISHSIDTSITHDDTHFTLTPIELIKDFGEPLLNTFERLKSTIKPYGLNIKSVDFAPKYQPPFKKILPFVVPFSKTANLAAKIIKKHYTKLKK